MTLESRANTDTAHLGPPANLADAPPPFSGIDPHRHDWRGFTGLLDTWIKAPKFNHTHYLHSDDYREVFDYLHLMLGRLRRQVISLRITDTGGGDERDQFILTAHNSKKFRIRPV